VTTSPGKKATLWDTVKAVGWSFFGVRKNSAYQEDLGKLNPLHIVVGLVLLVRHVVATA
jgi:hypothetical protein